ncbi:DUF1579 domain-containing protein [Undibacterium sp. CY18W]|uniref:DUF1579 domain-containing protein n=2 Tax=Undibacterium TaxID=401469 RepID=A0ABR6ZP26_9BURK|nr:DUF1579 domain-containing protein [Undibacterium hunanense]MBC3917235.1 DUF1579 domain-containing protein [Undibacterium hunanense]
MSTSTNTTGAADFDFFIGNWKVKHRRLKERLAQCQDWLEFTGTTSTIKIMGGAGNFDDNQLNMPDTPYCAATLRSFDASSGTWSIWWLDARYPGHLDTPMRGRFQNGIGEFYADDTFAGQPIRVRFLWTLPAPDMPRWEQAFSPDGGSTWETNWVMDFERQRE